MFGFFSSAQTVSRDKDKIEELLTRSVATVYPSAEFLGGRLRSGPPVSVYLGIDPTAPTLHLGHAIALRKLKQFQELGHRVVLLIGDFTGLIGDPTDKAATRKRLTKNEVLDNSALYQKQASTLIRFNGSNPAQLKYNSEWLSALSFEALLEIASHLTVEQLLKRDMFVRRMDEGKPIYLHEFLYPLMQAYDSVAMNVDGELGGNDQTFNMLTGRTLMKQLKNKEKFVIALKLLEDESGKKMGKTEGNMVALSDSPRETFGKIMSWSDGMIVPGFELCTNVSIDEIQAIKQKMEQGGNPKDSKVQLAQEIVKDFYGETAAEAAAVGFGEVPDNVLETTVTNGTTIGEALYNLPSIGSKSELRRLVAQGAVEDAVSGEIIRSIEHQLTQNQSLKIGKHRFVKIIVS